MKVHRVSLAEVVRRERRDQKEEARQHQQSYPPLSELLPERVAMTIDTVFDLASLTKPIATATSILLLVERGTIKLDDLVKAMT